MFKMHDVIYGYPFEQFLQMNKEYEMLKPKVLFEFKKR